MEFLPYLINLWDVDREIFINKGKELELEEMDIFFITGLSCQGEAVQIFGSHQGAESTKSLVRRYTILVQR